MREEDWDLTVGVWDEKVIAIVKPVHAVGGGGGNVVYVDVVGP